MTLDDSIVKKLTSLQQLQLRGATEAERKTAEKLLNKLMLKYNISDQDFLSAGKALYQFKARTELEEMLLIRIFEFMAPGTIDDATKYRDRIIKANLIYTDFVVINSAYEYFRRHMMAQ